jgi:hypothetical protein
VTFLRSALACLGVCFGRILKRKKLKGVRKVTLKASASCTDAAGNKGKAGKKLKLKR